MIRKTAFIIGASSDIGRAAAIFFAQNGYNLALTYNNAQIDLFAILQNYNIDHKAYQLDITNIQRVENVFQQVFEDFDYVDCVIICPGVSTLEKMLIDAPEDEMAQIIDVNLKAIAVCNKNASKFLLKQHHGAIVNLSSVYGISGGACEAIYSATKAGIIGLTKALARECAPFVRVNAVAPGFIETKMTSHFTQEEKKKITDKIPLARLGKSEDVAKAIYFLASDASAYITGEILTVSGGTTIF